MSDDPEEHLKATARMLIEQVRTEIDYATNYLSRIERVRVLVEVVMAITTDLSEEIDTLAKEEAATE